MTSHTLREDWIRFVEEAARSEGIPISTDSRHTENDLMNKVLGITHKTTADVHYVSCNSTPAIGVGDTYIVALVSCVLERARYKKQQGR